MKRLSAKYVLLSLLSFFISHVSFAQSWQWASRAGGSSIDVGKSIAVDASRNTYSTGYFYGSATFGSTSLTSYGGADIYVVKYNQSGVVQWAVKAGSTSDDRSYAIAVDDNGNTYITGQFQGTATFGSGTTITSYGAYDMFIAKYNKIGTFQWVQKAGSSAGSEIGNGICLTSNNDPVVTGGYQNTSTFGSTSVTSNGGPEIFLAKYDKTGAFQWVSSAGGTSEDNGYGIAVDKKDNFYITGRISLTATFGSNTVKSRGNADVFVAKYNSSGVNQWVRSAGGPNDERGWGVAVEASGDVFVAGHYQSTDTFGTSTVITSAGGYDAFLARYASDGTFQWVKSAGSTSDDHAYGVAADQYGNAFVTGSFQGTITVGGTSYTSSGGEDVFVASVDGNGNTLYPLQQAGNTSTDMGNGIALDKSANYYITGQYITSITFGSLSTLSGYGNQDAFDAKFKINSCLAGNYTIGGLNPDFSTFKQAVKMLDSVGICSSVVFDVRDGTYTEQVNLSPVSGSSESNTITFQSQSKDSSKVILSWPAQNGTIDNYVLQLNGGDNYIVRQITMQRTVNSSYVYATVVDIHGASCNNSFYNNRLITLKNGYYYYASGFYSSTDNDTGNIFDHNYIHYGGNGFYWMGNYTLQENSNIFTNNIIDSVSYMGMQMYYQFAPIISKNIIKNGGMTYGIYLYYCNDLITITKNYIYAPNGSYGLYEYYCGVSTGTVTQTVNSTIANNMIICQGTGLTSYYCSNQNYYHNNVLVTGSSTTTAAGYFQGYTTYYINNNIADNIFMHNGGGYSYFLTPANYVLTSDNNDLYTSGSNLAQWNGTTYSSLTSLKSGSGKDAKSLNINPSYVSGTNLHITNTNLNGVGKAYPSYVSDDYDDQNRSPNSVDIGADEIFPQSNDAGISQILPVQPYAAGLKNISVRLQNFGANTLTSATINWKLNGATQTSINWTGSLSSSGTAMIIVGSANFSVGSAYTVKAWTSSPNATSDGDARNDTMQTTTCPGLAGVYTIGGVGADYSTFSAAVASLTCGGVSGPVLFKVNPGTYTEQVDIPSIKYASSTNTITFDGGYGNNATRILTYNSTSALAAHTLRLNNTQFVRIRNITIRNTGTSYSAPLHIYGASSNCKVKNCVIEVYGAGTTSTNYLWPVLINNSTDVSHVWTAININNLQIDSNTINYGWSSIWAYISNGTNNTFRKNIISGGYVNGAYLYGFSGIKFNDNVVSQRANSYVAAGYGGVTITGGTTYYPNNFQITGNKFSNCSVNGLYVNASNNTNAYGEIYNNFFGGGYKDTANPAGLNLTGNYWYVYHNSFNLDQYVNATGGAGMYVGTANNVDIRNNNFANTYGSGYGLPLYINNTTSVTAFDFNNFYNAASNTNLLYFGGIYTKSTYQGGGGYNSYSINVNPDFVSSTDLHSTSPCMGNQGTPIINVSGIVRDIDGDLRSGVNPDMGADEYGAFTFDVDAIDITAPTTVITAGTPYVVTVKLVNHGTTTLTSMRLNYKLNSNSVVSQSLSGISFKPCDTLSLSFTSTSGSGSTDQRVTFSNGMSVIKAYTDKLNGNNVDQDHSNDTITKYYCSPLSGNFTINPSAPVGISNFQTFKAAVDALQLCGINGNVTFKVSNGTYSEMIRINEINGASATQRITFQSLSGDSSKVVLTQPAGTGSGPAYTLLLDSADYITFRHITISRTGNGTLGIVVLLANGANNNIFDGNQLIGVRTNSTSGNLSNVLTAKSNDNYNTFKNNYIMYGSNGIVSIGATGHEKGILIKNNVIDSIANFGIAIDSSDNALIKDNIIRNLINSNSYGILAYMGDSALTILKNKIYMPNGGFGIATSTSTADASNPALIANNFISMGGSAATSYGFYSIECLYQNFVYNNISQRNTRINSRALLLDATSSSSGYVEAYNNNLVNIGGGRAIELTSNAVSVGYLNNSDYNNIFVSGANIALYNGLNYTTLAAYQAASGFETNSKNVNPTYTSTSDLHVANSILNAAATPLTYVNDDIDNTTRNSTTPDIGADEFTPAGADAGISSIDSPSTSFCSGASKNTNVKVTLKNFGSTTITSVTINWSVNGASQTAFNWTGSLATNATASVIVGSYTFSAGATNIVAKTANPNGATDVNATNDSSTKSFTVFASPAANSGGKTKTTCIGVGVSIGATAVSGNTYSWTSNPSGFTSTSANPTVIPTTTTTYTLVETVTATGCTASNSITVTVNPLPAAAVGANKTICAGSSTTIGATAVSGSTYSWVSNPSGFTSTTANPTVSPTITTTYTLTETNSTTGCFNSNSVTVTVNPLPVPNAGNDATICSGSSASIGGSATNGRTYSWVSIPSGFTASTSSATVNPTVTTSYILTETITATGCSNKDTVVITVNAKPATPLAVNNGPLCTGENLVLTTPFVTNATYSWTGPNSYTASTRIATLTGVTSANAGTYSVTITVNGCTSSAGTTTLTVNSRPTPGITGSLTVCAGSSASYSTSNTSGSSFRWKVVGGVVTSGQFTNAVNVLWGNGSSGTIGVVETNSSGCKDSVQKTVTLNARPTPSVTGSNSVCVNSTSSYSTTNNTGNTYTWTVNGGSINSGQGTNTVSVTWGNGSFGNVKVVENNGCKDSSNLIITINPLPIVNVGTTKTICSGNSTSIGGSAVAGRTYSWVSNPSGFTSTSSNPTVSPTISTWYILTVANSFTSCTNKDSVQVIVNPLPSASVVANQSICSGGSISIGAASISGHTYSWVSNPSGFTSTSSNPSVSPSVTTTYTLTETITATGCQKSNSVTISVNPLPTANAGSNQTICSGQSTNIGATAVSGSTYSWTSNPSGFTSTSSNPSVSPTVTTTYTLTETITATGCFKSNAVTVTVNPLPNASVASNKTICTGQSTSIGAAAVSGNTYSWVSNPSGFTSTLSNPSVSPTVTTTYTLTETKTSTGCSKSNSVTITVNPIPSANVGSPKTICSGSSTSIGATAVNGNTYSWTSSPSGFTSTSSNPAVSPTITTKYYLTETAGTGCTKTDSVIVTVNPLPSANAGIAKTICSGQSTSIGASSVSGNTYSWTSSPSGFTSTSSNPSVSPTITTTYTLTETKTSTGCSNSNTVTVTVNPLPLANAGLNKSVCLGSSTTIGASAVSGNTYSWTSSPSGFSSTSSNPSVSPTINTTYTLTETVTATGCSNSNTVTVTVNPLPVAAVSGNKTICSGQSTSIGATAVSGSTYSWTSNPSGFTSTSSNPSVSPTTTTTYTMTETITATGCFKSNSVTVTVNPLPSASVASNKTICTGQSTSIGAAAVSGNTYAWTSSPSGFTSTSSNPSVSPTVTTTYTLTETKTSTGCSNSNSVTITVNPIPSANVGTPKTVCSGSSTTIGSTAVNGNTYSWTSNPSGFSSTASNPSVAPTVTTKYYLTETAGSGCSKTDSVTVTVNPLPSADAGSNKSICSGLSATIGAPAVSGSTYSWTSSPSGFTSTVSSPTVSPTVTTVYTLTETITATGCTKQNSVTVTVNPLPSATVGSNKAVCTGSSTSIGASAVSGNTYSWTSSPSGFTSTSSNPSVSPTITTTYTLTEIVTATGCSNSNAVTVTVNPLPSAAVSSSKTICSGASTSIGATAVSGSTYSWTSNPSGFSSTSSNPSVSPTVTTTYTMTETITATSCTNSNSVTVTVNPLPLANAGSNTSICSGSSTTIGAAAVSGNTYSWSPTTGLSSSTASNPTANPGSTTSYTLTETITATGCSKSNSVTVTVIAKPATPSASSNSPVCAGGTLTLSTPNVSNATYSWTGPNGFSSSSQNPSITNATTAATGNYSVTVTVNGCTSDAKTIAATVNALPTPNAGADKSICNSGSTTIGTAAVSGNTYSWTSSPSGFTSTSANLSVSPTTTTTYFLKMTNTATTCFNTDTVKVTVNAKPTPSISGSTVVCGGKTLSYSTTNNTGNTYNWVISNGTINSGQGTSTVSITWGASGSGSLKVIENNGCVDSASLSITINMSPTANVGSGKTICSSQSVSIGGSATSGHTYSWTSNPTGFTSTSANPNVSPTSTTTYYLTETITSSGCSNSDSVKVIVNPTPSAITGSNSTICNGVSVQLGATSVVGNTYSWTSNPSGFTSSLSNPVVTPSVTTTYTLTETAGAGCNKTNSVTITVNPVPIAKVGVNKTICSGSSTTIGGSAVSGNSYSWTSNPSGFTSSLNNPTVSPTVTTTYYLTQTITATGCSKSDSVIVTVNPLPTASVASGQTICNGNAVSIGASAVSGNTYSWTSNPSGFTSTSSNPSVTPSVTTTYTLTETITATGCTKSNSVTITVTPLPATPTAGSNSPVCVGSALNLTATTISGATYSWSGPNGFTSTSQNPSISSATTSNAGTYSVTVTVNGCPGSAGTTTVVVNPLPNANVASPSTICVGQTQSIGAAAVSGSTYSWTSNPSGFTSSSSNPAVSPTVTTTYTLTETVTATGCTNSNSVTVTVNPLPLATTGLAQTICAGQTVNLGASVVSGNTYSWTSNPSGFSSTSSNPAVNPTITTTYTLIETVTATGCSKSNSVIITVNPIPAVNVGTSKTICEGASVQIGAASQSGRTYSWTSNPSGFTSSASKPTVSPIVTTVYRLTVTFSATGCSNTDSVTVTVNPQPLAANSGNLTICKGSTVSIGSAAVSGNTYSWTSNPSGFTSTSSNPSVSPTTTTTYTLTETVTATGCSKTNSLTITVNPTPITPTVGSNSPQCAGATLTLTASSITGAVYSWTGPNGFTSTLQNPSITSATTAASGTYTVTASVNGCSATNASTVATINPLPNADAGNSKTICSGSSTTIGTAAVSGNTYSWTSNPSGFTSTSSNPSVSPTTATTYTLTETVTATGCTNSNTVTISVNPQPSATVAANQTICRGVTVSLGAATVSGTTYSWVSNPSGFTSTKANPTATPTVTTTYTLTQSITATGCSKSNSVTITVNPLPLATTGSDKSICTGTSTSIGATSVTGNTYSWTSSPSGFSSSISNPTVSPTTTTTYTLSETVTATGCNKSNSVTITVNPLPSASVISNTTICAGTSISIGASAIAGSTYSWSSSPVGFSSTSSNPLVTPTVTTTYTLTETVTATGCNKSNSVTITVNPIPTANAGSDKTVCAGVSASIGSVPVSGRTYVWSSNPSGFSSTTSSATVTPTITTDYILTVTITATGCTNSDTVTITVNPLPGATVISPTTICNGSSISIGGASTAGNTYSWTSNPAGFTSTSSNPTVTPSSTTTYTLLETNSTTGCSKTNSVKVTVNPVPNPPTVSNNSPLCEGSNLTLTASNITGATYSWTGPNGFTASTRIASITGITSAGAGAYSVTVTVGGCISNAASTTVVVNPLPLAVVAANQTICSGNSVAIGGTAVGGNTYSWKSTPSGFSSTSSNPAVSPSVTTIYTLTETNSTTGCKASNSVTITVNPLPNAPVIANTSICSGNSISIGAAALGSSSYSWVSNPSGFTSTSSNPSVSPTTTTTYTLTETDNATGCSKSNSVTITVNPLPGATVIADKSVCGVVSTSIGAASIAGHTYSWVSNPSGFVSTNSNPSVSPSVTTTYTLTEKITATGCTNSNSVTITVGTLPSASVISNTSICAGSSISIGSSPKASSSYSWVSNPSGFTSSSANPSVSPTITTTYTLTETDNLSGCNKSNSVTITVNPLPTAAVSSSKSICEGSSTSIGAATVSGHTYSWISNPSGFTSTLANPSVTPTVNTTYTLTETITSTGCSNSNSVTISVNPLPTANAGTSGAICFGGTTTIGAAPVSGNSYSWTSNPSGFTSTSSSPSVSPTVNTTYTLTETVTATGCSKSNSVTITINPLPSAPVISSTSICNGSSISIGAAAKAGSTFSWVSNPSGFTSTVANPSVSPTVTTTYTLTETFNGSGCSKSNSVTITVNPLPSATVIADKSVCGVVSTSIGATSIAGHTYSWVSNPSGFTSTSSNPSVSPSVSTTYTLTETITATGCSKSNSVTITVGTLPNATVIANTGICTGSAISIGASAKTGSTYSWVSNPSGFTSTSSNPSVSPTITTTYTLTETDNLSGCSKSNSVVITVNPLPSATVASNKTNCGVVATSIGAASVSGHTYSWTSNPSGFTSTSSNPSVSPSVTTTYTLTETITATGCTNSNSVTITINPLPSASVASNTSICSGNTISIGATAVSGNTYSWVSNPSGFTSTTANPTVNPTVTTTYTLTETVTATGCSKSNSVIITILAAPVANAGPDQKICSGSSVKIGVSAVSGSTYAWTSNPSGFTSTLANPTVNPTITTTYILVATKTASACTKNDTVLVTVNPLPAAVAGSAKTVCSGTAVTLGTTAVSGHTYTWVSSPVGFTSTSANPTVTPTKTTTYTVTEKDTTTGCTNSNSVTITMNATPSANVGSAKTICEGTSTTIGAAAVSGNTYSWTSNPSGFTSTTSNPSVSPTVTTKYYLTETITSTGCTKTDSVIITVYPLPSANTGTDASICKGSTTQIGATAVSGSTYKWSSIPGGFTSTSSNPFVTPSVSTTYILTETNAAGCKKTDSVIITVNPLPTPDAGKDASICVGQSTSVGVAAVNGNTYSWTSNPAGFTSTSANPSVSPVVTTTYNLTQTNTATGCSASDSVVITVNKLPTPTISGVASICVNNSASYSAATTTGTYVWKITGGSILSGGTSSTVVVKWTSVGTGILELVEKNSNGCKDSITKNVTVNPRPVVVISGSNSVCAGSKQTYSDTATVSTYLWKVTGGTISSGQGTKSISVTWGIAGTGTIKLIETNSNGCNDSSSVSVTINANPVASILGKTPVCEGTSSTYKAGSTGNTNTWNVTGGTVTKSTNDSITILWGTAGNGTIKLKQVGAGGCSDSITSTIKINAKPLPTVSGKDTVCSSSSIVYKAPNQSGASYLWSAIGGTVTSGQGTNSATITWGVAGNGKVKVLMTNTSGCSDTASMKVNINAAPSITISGANSVCVDDVKKYSVNNTSGATYKWIISGGKITAGNNTDSITVKWNSTAGAGKLNLTVTSSLGCATTDSFNVNINSKPTPTIFGDTAGCVLQSSIFSVDAVAGDSYVWSVTGGSITSGQGTDIITVLWTANGLNQVKVTQTNPSGCEESDSVKFPVYAAPNPVIAGKLNVCLGNTDSFSVKLNSGSTYQWNTTSGLITQGQSTEEIHINWTALGNATITLLEINANGCSFTDSFNVMVNDLPRPKVAGPFKLCDASTAAVYTSPTGTGNNIQWVVNGGKILKSSSNDTIDSVTVKWNGVGKFYLKIIQTNAAGCFGQDSALITIDSLPKPNINGSNTACVGETGNYFTPVVDTTHKYFWTVSNALMLTSPDSNAISISFNNTGKARFTVYEYTVDSCLDSTTYTVDVNPLPTVNITRKTDSLIATSGFVTYQWYLNGTAISGATSDRVKMSTAGKYVVRVTNNNGCSNVSPEYIYVINGIAERSAFEKVELFPNPTQGNIQLTITLAQPENLHIYLTDMLGKTIMILPDIKAFAAYINTFDMSGLAAGVYSLHIEAGSSHLVKKVVKE